ncbi:RNA-directed DNA polymerase, eukaryota, Reverse transcriptase zinc-binding domain protein [Artemisia annua]|uniref:RNA-directed DNA polymerase, eukaryota, Reverse transcriptase zinc-binding domain protein n=1 Tax=Artemisia annua TaxID=35608 RepID=A0A2U1NW23_ARTAN|nr:RNA-directed DNA polymerase, eukaryota, Reverse transcriptase zinc-binding domain protein [Artemisia annua]
MSWVTWKKYLVSKKMGGLGIGSIFALNVGLLFKWLWRFLHNSSDLWIKVIKYLYGEYGGIFNDSMQRLSLSPWSGILSSVKSLKDKGIDLLSLCIRKVGNGISIRFWDEIWCGNSPLKNLFPLIYMLDNDRGCNVASRVSLQDWSYVLRRTVRGGIESAQLSDLQHLIRDVVLSDNNDSWNWSLDITKGFTVASFLWGFGDDSNRRISPLTQRGRTQLA